jgi:hypothetical protein
MIKLYCILCSLILVNNISHSQSTIYNESNRFYVYYDMDKPEILDTATVKMILDSVTSVAIKFKIKTYKQLYNVDSMFNEADKMQRFINNPYILEYPELEHYDYRPEYYITNIRTRDRLHGNDTYLRSFFEVDKTDYFIRAGNSTLNIKSDTLFFPRSLSTEVCGSYDRNYAIFYNSDTKDFFIMGGCLPLSPVPEKKPLSKFPDKPWTLLRKRGYDGGCVLYAQTRMINQLPNLGQESEMVITSFRDTIKKIGSLKLDKSRASYQFYLSVPSKYCYYEKKCNPEKLWLILTYTPDSKFEFINYGHGYPDELIKWEEWGPVEAINFVKLTGSNQSELEKCPGYKPGFKYYERYRRIINAPLSVWDTVINVRGITESELAELRKIEGLDELLPKK